MEKIKRNPKRRTIDNVPIHSADVEKLHGCGDDEKTDGNVGVELVLVAHAVGVAHREPNVVPEGAVVARAPGLLIGEEVGSVAA